MAAIAGARDARPKRALIGRRVERSAASRPRPRRSAADFQPLTDLRASSAYRLQAAGNLLRRFYLEHAGAVAPLRTADRTCALASRRTRLEIAPRHESAHLHVSGRALYADDIALPANALHAAFGLSRIAHGRIRDAAIWRPVRRCRRVAAVAVAATCPARTTTAACCTMIRFSPTDWCSTPVSRCSPSPPTRYGRGAQGRRGRARVDYEPLPAILDVRAALAAQSYVLPTERAACAAARTRCWRRPRTACAAR